MRKGFEGLYGLVRDRLLCEPLSGHLFLFCNAQRNRLKILVWDGSGLWVCSKKLLKGRYRGERSVQPSSERCPLVSKQAAVCGTQNPCTGGAVAAGTNREVLTPQSLCMSVCPTSRLARVLARTPVLQGFSRSPFGRTLRKIIIIMCAGVFRVRLGTATGLSR
jgi:hypothetical protein